MAVEEVAIVRHVLSFGPLRRLSSGAIPNQCALAGLPPRLSAPATNRAPCCEAMMPVAGLLQWMQPCTYAAAAVL